jgi:GNAT superfamily N-acetyltransferase
VCLIPPYKSNSLFYAHFMRSVIPLGKPPPREMGEEVAARFDAFGDQTMKEHHGIMKDYGPHWYVCNFGVSEAVQGQGVGRILNQTVFGIANGAPVYLECHDENVNFYKKMGYDHQKRYLMTPKTKTTPFAYNGFTYGVRVPNQD